MALKKGIFFKIVNFHHFLKFVASETILLLRESSRYVIYINIFIVELIIQIPVFMLGSWVLPLVVRRIHQELFAATPRQFDQYTRQRFFHSHLQELFLNGNSMPVLHCIYIDRSCTWDPQWNYHQENNHKTYVIVS